MANELNNFGDMLRFMLIPVKQHDYRPILVVQVYGTYSQVKVFGLLMDNSLDGRITTDINRCRIGDASCSVTV